jgi:sterol desaturase/sphingolipid hydroxylase (fatty acid hydroxylase superfamily)
MQRCVRLILHPALLAGSWGLWSALGHSGDAWLLAIALSYAIVSLCERWIPAHPEWTSSPAERASVYAVAVLGFLGLGAVAALYGEWIRDPLADARSALGFAIWPSGWPLLLQALLVYFANEGIYYGVHRGIHRSGLIWRASGHGFHHAYRNMHAAMFGASHPLELVLLALPAALVAGALGASEEVMLGAVLLQTVNAIVVHANVDTDSRGIGLLFTTPAYHRAHHSNEFAQSNTNYSCNAIVWDRLFGTFSDRPVVQTGIGLQEPTLVEKLLLPVREPSYVRTAPRR